MSTSASQSGLDRSLVSGIAWTAILRWSAQLVSWFATFYAARRLAPGDYGLVSMAMIGIGLARMVEDFGLDSILIQDRSIAGSTQSRLAGFLIGIGFGLCVLFMLLAQPIAAFFNEPELTRIIRILSLLFLFDAVQVVPRAQLQRDLQFRRLAVVAFVQVAATSAVLVTAVTTGLGRWSLILNSIAGGAAATVLLLFWHPYAVAWPRDIAKTSRPLLQGWRLLSSRAAWYGYSNADQTIIGRVLGKDALGAYSFASTFSILALQEIGAVITKVVPGIFSEVQEQRDLLRRYFLLLTEFVTTVTFPMSIGLALTADLLVPLALGDDWGAVVGPLRPLCLYTVYLAAQLLTSHLLLWTGQFRTNMWCSIVTGVTMPLALLAGSHYGLEGIAWVWALVFPLANAPSVFFALRTIRVSSRQWLNSMAPAICGCALMSLAVFAVRAALPAGIPSAAVAGLSVLTGMIVYSAVVWVGFGTRVKEMIAVASTLRGRKTGPVEAVDRTTHP